MSDDVLGAASNAASGPPWTKVRSETMLESAPGCSTQASGEELLIEEALFTSGRPALVVPYVGAEPKPPETVICAWDAGAEAARAFNDGMPLLRAAKRVVVMVGEPQEHEGEYGEEPGADIALHLARHGVRAEVEHMHGSDIDVGNMLLSRIADESADLLVMGAYRHSRLRQLVFGGVTRTILEHMTVPVLMAHSAGMRRFRLGAFGPYAITAPCSARY